MTIIIPSWPAPANIHACTTLRKNTKITRELLKQNVPLPAEPIWLNQIHSAIAIEATPVNQDQEADATFTNKPQQVCVVLTADCLPILLCHREGTHVAAVHAGWRGLCKGIIESTLSAMDTNPAEIMAWLGPAISQPNYEVGNEVRDLFLQQDEKFAAAFIPSSQGRWLANLYQLARMRLNNQGVSAIYGGEFCTFGEPERFHSYRREGIDRGSMASFIWIR